MAEKKKRAPAAKRPAAKRSTAKRKTSAAAAPRARGKTTTRPKGKTELTVEAAVKNDIERIANLDDALAGGVLAANALALAREMDKPKNSATSKSMVARTLNETMEKLRTLVPEEPAADEVDELAKRRSERRARVAS